MSACRRCTSAARLEVEGLSVAYSGPTVVRAVSLSVHAGETVALLGRNGAGKTTTLLAIAGALRASAGRIVVDGASVTGRRSFEVARHGLSLVPQGRRVFPNLSVRENLTLGDRGGERGGDLEAVYRLFPVLRERARQRATTLSGGEQQMLAIGRALMTRPSVLLLDEPSEGLAPQVVSALGKLLGQLRAEQEISILLAEQNLRLALDVADRVYVLERGELVHQALAAAFDGDRSSQRRFLGV